ncbi:MAG: hypothetical protein O3C27_07130 [Actinomycetota bacterium]|nr:hypothetical protein [Actinomycetota bacterium]
MTSPSADGGSQLRPAQLGAIAACGAVVVGFALQSKIPGGLPEVSDIVGYPTANGFDVRRLRNVYLWWLFGVPALAVAFYLGVRRLQAGSGTTVVRATAPIRFADDPSDLPSEVASPTVVAACLRGVVAGLILGGEVGGMAESRIGGSGLAWTVGGGLAGGVASVAAFRRSNQAHAWLIASMLVGAVLGLTGLSRTTAVLTVDQQVHRLWPWLPLWLGILLTILTATWLVRILRSASSMIEVAHRSLVVLGGMLAQALLRARLPGAQASPDLFHHGEQLSGARLLLDGAWPWRDFLAIHGITLDSLHGAVGFLVFEESFWGLMAGWLTLVDPLAAALMYLLLARLVRYRGVMSSVFCVALLGLPLIADAYLVIHTRAILLPVVLLTLIRFIDRSSWTRAAIACGLAFLLVVGTPEMAYLLPGCAVALLLTDWARRDSGASWRANFPATARFGVCGLVYTTVFASVLAAAGALDDFVFMVRTFAPDHDLTGGIPILITGIPAKVAMYGTPLATLGTIALVYWRRSRLTSVDLVMLALAIFNVGYYTKFLSRADMHVLHPWGTATPLLAFLAVALVDAVALRTKTKSPAQRRLDYAVVSLGFAFIALFPVNRTAASVGDLAGDLSERLRPADPGVETPELGYTRDDGSLSGSVTDLRYLLDESAGRPLTVFDFGNQPGLFQFMLAGRNPTRYPHVSMAIREKTQQDLIAQLEASPPDVIAYQGVGRGLYVWDGLSNSVRHYRVSEWVLRNYEPWLEVGGQRLMQRNGLGLPGPDEVEPFLSGTPSSFGDVALGPTCDWFEAAERLPFDGGSPGGAQEVAPAASLVRLAGWVLRDGVPPTEVLAVVAGQANAVGRIHVDRPDVVERFGLAAGTVAGYDLVVPLFAAQSADVALVALWPDGSQSVVAGVGSAAARDAAVVSLGAAVDDGSQTGNLDTYLPVVRSDFGFDLGAGKLDVVGVRSPQRADASWLRLQSSGLEAGTQVRLGASLSDPDRQIAAESIGDDDFLTIRVGSCPQWHGRADVPLWITSTSPLGEASIVLSSATGG